MTSPDTPQPTEADKALAIDIAVLWAAGKFNSAYALAARHAQQAREEEREWNASLVRSRAEEAFVEGDTCLETVSAYLHSCANDIAIRNLPLKDQADGHP
jgi:hypothetical protein